VIRRILSLRAHLLVLTLGTLLPMLALVVVATAIVAERERALIQRGAVERTRALLSAVDAQLLGHVASLKLLAESPNLDATDLQPFYDELTRMLPTQLGWHSISLADPGGRRLFGTEHPFGAPQPHTAFESFATADLSNVAVVSDLFLDDGEYRFAIHLPVVRDEDVRFVLSAVIEPWMLLALLRDQQVSPDWVAGVVDRNRRIVARTMANEQTFGHLASESLRAALDRQRHGWFRGMTLEGEAVYTSYLSSDFSGWAVAVGIPNEFVNAGAAQAVLFVLIGLAIALGLALLLARNVSLHIARPIGSLARTARTLGRGEAVVPPDAGTVREVHEMGEALMAAAKAVQERELRLREADRAKDDFLAMLGHELRNPLSALSSASQVLQITGRDEVDGPRREVTSIIDRQVRHMARLVDDLLDAARITTGKVTLDRRPINLAEAVARTVRGLRASGQAEEHDLRLGLSPVWMAADESRIDQIVSNLLSNAVRHTPASGRIDVRVFRREDRAVLEVADTGAGLAPDVAPRIFDLFFQGQQPLDRTSGGLGVGLTLVRNLARLHGGEATAHSEGPGRGTCVTVSFPAIEEPGGSTGDVAPQARCEGRGESVLLVEDNADVRRTLREALTLYGYEVLEAADGRVGIAIAERAAPRIVVVDIGLPGIDGMEVARRLRCGPGGEDKVLIAISGYGQQRIQQSVAESGFDDFITKPVAPDALAEKIAVGLSRLPSRTPTRG
jgi:signal transduction histidine kinase/CheY-like chemotaxis protein